MDAVTSVSRSPAGASLSESHRSVAVPVGGPFWRRIEPALRSRIEELVNADAALIPHHPIFVPNSTIGEDVAAVGAGCLVLDQTLAPHTSALLISR